MPYDTKINQYKIVATAHDGHGHNVDIPITINVNHVPILENLDWLTVVEAKKAGVDLAQPDTVMAVIEQLDDLVSRLERELAR